jgi:hypothetical protein
MSPDVNGIASFTFASGGTAHLAGQKFGLSGGCPTPRDYDGLTPTIETATHFFEPAGWLSIPAGGSILRSSEPSGLPGGPLCERRRCSMRFRIGLLGAAGLVAWAAAAQAEPTRITVRVLSRDAKFVGTSMGGMRVTIRDADTGEVLAQGLTQGGTGDTQRIMRQDWKRGAALSTEGAARFATTLDLDEPRRVEITAHGPLAQPQSAGSVSVTQWLLPGKHLDQGDGVLLVLPGFAVDVLAPPVHARPGKAPQQVTVRANLVML